jgi:hypothetical protein
LLWIGEFVLRKDEGLVVFGEVKVLLVLSMLVLWPCHDFEFFDNLVLMLIINGELVAFLGLGIQFWDVNLAMFLKGGLFEGYLASALLFGIFL